MFEKVSGPWAQNPNLLAAIREMSLMDNPVTRARFYQALMESALLIPLPGDEADIPRVLPGGTNVNFTLVTDSTGRKYLPVFTDDDALRAWQPQGAVCAKSGGPQLFDLALQLGAGAVLINYKFHTGATLEQREVEMLARGVFPETSGADLVRLVAPDGARHTFGPPPAGLSPDLATLLGQALSVFPAVASAYLYQAAITGQPPRLTLGVCFSSQPDEGSLDRVAEALGRTARPYLGRNEYLDITVLEGASLEAVSQAVRPIFLQPTGPGGGDGGG